MRKATIVLFAVLFLFACTKEYEYTTIRTTETAVATMIAKMGNEGWKLVSKTKFEPQLKFESKAAQSMIPNHDLVFRRVKGR